MLYDKYGRDKCELEIYKAKGSQVLYLNSKALFELATVITLSSWQFSLYDGEERNYRQNNCNYSLSIHLFNFEFKWYAVHDNTQIFTSISL